MPKLTRRQILAGGIGSAFLPPLAYFASVSFGGYREYSGLQFFSNKEAAILESIGEVIVPNENPIGVTIYEAELVKNTDELMTIIPSHNQSRVKLLLWAVEHLFPSRCFYFKKFTNLDLAEREKIFRKLEASNSLSTRALMRAIKTLVQAIYYNNSLVAQKMGIDGRCLI